MPVSLCIRATLGWNVESSTNRRVSNEYKSHLKNGLTCQLIPILVLASKVSSFRWSTTEEECHEILASVTSVSQYLAVELYLFTDHKNTRILYIPYLHLDLMQM